MTRIYIEGFEGSFPGSWTKAGTQQALSTQDATASNSGSNSYKVDTTGASGTSNLTRTPAPANAQTVSGRFYVRVDTRPGATATIFQLSVAAGGTHSFAITSGGLIRAQISGTGVNKTGALTNGQWYRVDFKSDNSTNPRTLDWQVDGVAQTQVSVGVAAANFTSHVVGMITSGTIAIHLDDIIADDDLTTYPIGPVNVSVAPSAASLTAAGTTSTIGFGIIPPIATLTTTGQTSGVTATDNQRVSPSVAALTLTGIAATVTASDRQIVTPTVGTLTATGIAPTVTASDNQVVSPSVIALTTAGQTPTVTASDNQAVAPSPAALTVTGETPTVATPVAITPDVAALALTLEAPTVTVSDAEAVVPDAASLTLTGIAPTVTVTAGVGVIVSPPPASLVLTGIRPGVKAQMPSLGWVRHERLVGTKPVRVIPQVARLHLVGMTPNVWIIDDGDVFDLLRLVA